MHYKYIVILAIVCCFDYTTAGYYPQYLQAFRYKSCLGPATNFLETNTNVTADYPGIYFLSESSQGLWRYAKDGLITTSLQPLGAVATCGTTLDTKTPVLISVKNLATGDFDDSVLTLYPLEEFDGEPVVIDEKGLSKVEQDNFNVGSWALTGPKSFTVFDGENFSGSSTCLEVDPFDSQSGNGLSVMWNMNTELVVKSARIGCEGRKMKSLRGNGKSKIVTRDGYGKMVKEGVRSKLETFPEIIV